MPFTPGAPAPGSEYYLSSQWHPKVLTLVVKVRNNRARKLIKDYKIIKA